METMTLNNTLEAFTLGGAYNSNFLTFGEDFTSDGITNLLINGTITNFFYYRLGRSVCLSEVIDERFRSVFLFSLTISNLQGVITVGIYGLLLGNHARTSLDNRTGDVSPFGIKNAGHSYFFSNNS